MAVAALGVAVAGCSHGSSPRAGAPKTASPTTAAPRAGSATTTAPGPAGAAGGATGAGPGAGAACTGATLAGRLLDATSYNVGFGDWLVELRNTAATPCTMTGYPTTVLLDDRGQPLPTREHRGAGPAVGGRLPEEVDLQAGGAAVFGLETYACTGSASQTSASQLLVTAPGDTTPITIKLDRGITSCTGGDVLVSPVRQNPTAGIPT